VGLLDGFRKDPAALLSKEKAQAAVEQLSALIMPAEPKNVPEEIQGFREAFEDLLTQARIGQLLVLIDDLDRCLPDTAIETLEAIRLFVFT
jgi:predicted KAP-like P-loop ATPase